MQFLVAAILGYFLGCFQTAFVLGKFVGKLDIREKGSNNAGASNVTIVMGWKYGILTAVIDIMKAIVAVLLMKWLFPNSDYLYFVSGFFAIIGHIFPFYLKFKGGKGTASIIGMALAIDFKIATILILTIIIVTILTDYIAIGTLAIVIIWPIAKYIAGYSVAGVGILCIIAAISIYKHLANYKRILNKEETGLRSVFQKK